MYYQVISKSEIEKTSLKEIRWLHSKLVDQKKREANAMKGGFGNG